jgi:NAD(P)H-flavin reductase
MYKKASIRWIKKETRDTATYCLKLSEKFVFHPGQFNMLYVPGIGEAPMSISSSVAAPEVLHTIRIAGDVTTSLSQFTVGDTIMLRGPYGSGWPLEELKDRALVIVAGGLGIAPLRPLLREVMRNDYGLDRKPVLLYGSKSPKDIIFRDEFPRFRDVFDVYMTVDKADPEMVWRGETGFVTDIIRTINFNPLKSVALICGPEVMMKISISILLDRGVPAEKIYLSMERSMNCGRGICGHCMFGPFFVCKDGPVFRYSDIRDFIDIKEL